MAARLGNLRYYIYIYLGRYKVVMDDNSLVEIPVALDTKSPAWLADPCSGANFFQGPLNFLPLEFLAFLVLI